MRGKVKIQTSAFWRNVSDYPYENIVEPLTATIAKTLLFFFDRKY